MLRSPWWADPRTDERRGFRRHLDWFVLPGDIEQNNNVLGSDVTKVRNSQGQEPGYEGTTYTIFKDVDGSATILGNDVTLAPAPEPLLAPRVGSTWRLVFSSEAAKYARGRLALPEMLQQFEAEARAAEDQ